MTALIVRADNPVAQAWAQALAEQLQAAGDTVLADGPCHKLVRQLIWLAPQTVVAWGPGLPARMVSALTLLAATAARPVAVAGAQLGQRKWVDRAKVLLMRHRQLNEDDAFALLRAASRQAGMRVGRVSRRVIQAARSAESVNLAGQLRRLSLRLSGQAILVQPAAGTRGGAPWRSGSADDPRFRGRLDGVGAGPAGLRTIRAAGRVRATHFALRAQHSGADGLSD